MKRVLLLLLLSIGAASGTFARTQDGAARSVPGSSASSLELPGTGAAIDLPEPAAASGVSGSVAARDISGTGAAIDLPEPCGHPRLLMHSGYEVRVREAIAADPVMADAYSFIKSYSDKVLALPPCERVVTGRRLLSVSREVLQRVFWLSMVYRVEGGQEYASRAIEEMLAVASFSDWNPTHFLDAAEMTAAMAVGYDWLYDRMTPEQRDSVRSAIIAKGLDRAQDPKYNQFYRMSSNWNQVCNGGITMGALAVWEDNLEQSAALVLKCLETNGKSLDNYSAEGAYPEGYGYWTYGSSFQILLISSLESAFGSDLGLMEGHESFYRSGDFMMMMSTPSHHVFSYFDGGRNQSFIFQQAWLAARTGNRELLYPELQLYRDKGFANLGEGRLFPLFLISGSRLLHRTDAVDELVAVLGPRSSFAAYGADPGSAGSRLAGDIPERNFYVCSGLEPLFIYRSGWTSPADTYFAVKGGCAQDSHGHVDVGSFIYESDGVSWALDLGSQDYHSLESRGVDLWNNRPGSQRWDVFRISEYSHNLLTVRGSRANVSFRAKFSKVWQKRSRKGVDIPMTGFYGGQLDSARRTVWLDRKNDLHVEEHFIGGDTTHVLRWLLMTEAECRILGPKLIELKKDGQVRYLKISTKHYASPRVYEAKGIHDYDAPNPGMSRVGFEIKRVLPHEKVTLRITLTKRP